MKRCLLFALPLSALLWGAIGEGAFLAVNGLRASAPASITQ
jgi:hypothetical protein